jgi:hypothetical protein
MRPFFGKYRGTVTSNIDPQNMGRVQVSVPAVLGEGRLSWAMPCAPFAGNGVGFFAVPPVGANVWVEFEAGDPDYPIWSGGFWGIGEAPAQPALPFVKVLKTEAVTLKLDDTPGAGGFTLEVGPPAVAVPVRIVCDSGGVEISTGASKIEVTSVSVSVNGGALEVI